MDSEAPIALPDPSDVKQVIVIRRDLKMRRGKEIAQGAHASMAWLTALVRAGLDPGIGVASLPLDDVAVVWLTQAQRKIAVQAHSEDELRELHEAALARGLRSHLVTDAGHTEFGGVPTITALAVGPGLASAVDEVTGHLGLY